MRVVGAIPARWASTRFPGKALALLDGRPLLAWVIEACRRAARLDALIVATDDDRIAAAAAACGAAAVMTADTHPSGTDRIAEALRDTEADLVINIQGDEPFMDPALIDRLADAMAADASWDMATAATPIRSREEAENPSVVKVVCGRDGRALYFSRSLIPYVRSADGGWAAGRHRRHLGIYAYRREFLYRYVDAPAGELERDECLEQLRALAIGARILVLETVEAGLGVDMPEDLRRAEARLAGGKEGKQA
jgi:3-deoxy-manno-octulosonate cytidylyltransferase (CMP-KDO synthetase)